ncbi:hypothetical protein [Polaribacter butkevichii]|uniref:Lipoprotein n=1 Tax=Polaribacter butkevichii TaxID=218490 RepID=A0A2P6C9R5_9FLAO|nr:hypothetical protein [Polaribacter butkevichii]PQJ69675.1 hypothetical protein BTO14_16925 [Polaribacter butkevichii]
MKKNLIILFVLATTISCGIKTFKLKNGYSRAAINEKVYKNKKHFEKGVLKDIDTQIIYEEYNTTFYSGDKPINVLARKNYENPHTSYEVYKFYENGNFNLFILNRENSELKSNMFDPEFTGWRGVLYSKNGEIKGDLITQVSGMGNVGIIKQTFEFRGDSLLINRKGNSFGKRIYIKRKIPIELLKNNAEW